MCASLAATSRCVRCSQGQDGEAGRSLSPRRRAQPYAPSNNPTGIEVPKSRSEGTGTDGGGSSGSTGLLPARPAHCDIDVGPRNRTRGTHGKHRRSPPPTTGSWTEPRHATEKLPGSEGPHRGRRPSRVQPLAAARMSLQSSRRNFASFLRPGAMCMIGDLGAVLPTASATQEKSTGFSSRSPG